MTRPYSYQYLAALAVSANNTHTACGFASTKAYRHARTRKKLARASRKRNRS